MSGAQSSANLESLDMGIKEAAPTKPVSSAGKGGKAKSSGKKTAAGIKKGGSSGGKKGGDDDESLDNFTGGGGKGARGRYVSYNAGVSNAVEMLKKLPQIQIGAVEFLTFFPHHTQWPAVMLRLFRNEWLTSDMAKYTLYARDSLTHAEYDRRKAALRHQLRTIVRAQYGEGVTANEMKRPPPHAHIVEFAPHSSGNNCDLYDVRLPQQASGLLYMPPRNRPLDQIPPSVNEVTNGVVNWPAGEDAGVLTQALRWCLDNGQGRLTMDDIPQVIANRGFILPAEANGDDWDQNGLGRFTNAVADPTP